PLEHPGARGLAPELGHLRRGGASCDRQGARGLPRGPRVPCCTGMSTRPAARIERLRPTLDERLLVTNLVNIRYLTGFETSNAALLVDPQGGASLYTDFRYIEAAEEVDGVEAHRANRTLLADLAERLDGRIAFEADVLPYSQVETLRAGGLELVPSSGAVGAPPRGQGRRRDRDDRPRRARGGARVRGAHGRDVGRAERTRAGLAPAPADARTRRRRAVVRDGDRGGGERLAAACRARRGDRRRA